MANQPNLSQVRYFSNARPELDRLHSLIPDSTVYQLENLAHFSLDPTATEIGNFTSGEHRAAYEFWLENRGASDLPAAGVIDPIELREALGSLILLEPNGDFSDFRNRLFGSTLAQEIGDDMTGRWVSEYEPAMARCYIDQYVAAAKLRAPLYSEHQYVPKPGRINVCSRLFLPFVDDKSQVNRIMVCVVPVRQDD